MSNVLSSQQLLYPVLYPNDIRNTGEPVHRNVNREHLVLLIQRSEVGMVCGGHVLYGQYLILQLV